MPTKTTRVSRTGVARGTTTARTAAERVNATSPAPSTKTTTSSATTMLRPSCRSDGLACRRDELHDGVDDRVPRLAREVVTHARDHEQARAGHGCGCRPPPARRDERVALTVDDEGGHPQRAQRGCAVARGRDRHELTRHAGGVEAAVVGPGRARASALLVEREAG